MDSPGASTATAPALPAAGWYRDPSGRSDLRWWSGSAWTDATRAIDSEPAVPAAVSPEPAAPPPPVAPPAVEPPAPAEPVISRPIPARDERIDIERTRAQWRRIAASRKGIRSELPNTPAIWVLAVLPIPSLALIGVSVLFARDGNLVGALLAQVAGVIGYLALIVWDRLALARQNLLAPSLWWQLIPISLIYFLVRRIALRRQGVISHAPGNVYVIALVASVALCTVTLLPLVMQSAREMVAQQIENRIAADFAVVGEQAVAECPPAAVLTPGARVQCSVEIAGGRLTIPIQFEVQPDLTTVPVQYRPMRGLSG